MERPVEVVLFQRGELQSVRTLSPRRERRAVWTAAVATAAAVVLAMLGTVALVSSLGFVVHGPTFVAGWISVALAVAVVAASRARWRARRYTVGSRIDADAFAPVELDLVRRVGRGDDYDVGLTPGMSGTVEHGRSPLAVEGLARAGSVRVPLPGEGKVQIELGPTTFVIRRRVDAAETGPRLAERLRAQFSAVRRLMPLAGASVPIAAVATFLGAAPAARALDDADLMLAPVALAENAADHVIRQAQRQVGSLGRCFAGAPDGCHRPGYMRVVLSVTEGGGVRSTWIAGSTYGHDCPVSACVADTAESWVFSPTGQSIDVAVPVRVVSPQPRRSLPVVLTPASTLDQGATTEGP